LIREGFPRIYSKLIYNLAEIAGLVLELGFFGKQRNLQIFCTGELGRVSDCSGFRNKQMRGLRKETSKTGVFEPVRLVGGSNPKDFWKQF
jgi:hypothetical protein